MGDKSKISWTDATWNPVVGCTKVSEGCAHCYAERDHNKRHKAYCEGKLQNIPQYSKPFNKVQLIESRLEKPPRWKRPRKIFVNSQSDLFHPDVPFKFIDLVFASMALCPQHTFQILTKRPERMLQWFNYKDPAWAHEDMRGDQRIRFQTYHMFGSGILYEDWTWPLKNVWIGVTAENQEQWDIRTALLKQIRAAVKFVSIEPMLGPVDMRNRLHSLVRTGSEGWPCSWADSINGENPFWVICGGESGSNARPMHPNWTRSLRDQCVAAGIDFYFKQWGEWIPWDQISLSSMHDELRKALNKTLLRTIIDNEIGPHTMPNQVKVSKVGTKKAGNLLDGQFWQQMPKVA